ncbi:hypothetical protein Salmuc_03288 [Salipiger mucosus DSM 16094]|uniref:Uncharacterized protein n=2 Tax=Salipiger mucosus TaxID=263378 RepID=S9Q9B0_9RHOB|nr:hypothetical protein Salmuc_03288 [Salipiger mucosus DSM 16094]
MLDHLPKEETMFGITQAENFLESILRALNPNDFGYIGDDAVERLTALESFKDQVTEKLEKAAGRRVGIGPLVMRKNGTKAVMHDIQKVTLVPVETPAAEMAT